MPQQPLSTIKALAVMHFSLLVGQLMFAGIAFYLKYTQVIRDVIKDEEVRLLVVPGLLGVAVVLVMASFLSFKKKIAVIRKSEQAVTEKLTAYRAASIIRWAMLEAPVLLIIIAYLLTGKQVLWGVIAVLLLLFLYTKPTVAKAASELGITEAEVL
jgi:DMSO reductase anchor subunit